MPLLGSDYILAKYHETIETCTFQLILLLNCTFLFGGLETTLGTNIYTIFPLSTPLFDLSLHIYLDSLLLIKHIIYYYNQYYRESSFKLNEKYFRQEIEAFVFCCQNFHGPVCYQLVPLFAAKIFLLVLRRTLEYFRKCLNGSDIFLMEFQY